MCSLIGILNFLLLLLMMLLPLLLLQLLLIKLLYNICRVPGFEPDILHATVQTGVPPPLISNF